MQVRQELCFNIEQNFLPTVMSMDPQLALNTLTCTVDSQSVLPTPTARLPAAHSGRPQVQHCWRLLCRCAHHLVLPTLSEPHHSEAAP